MAANGVEGALRPTVMQGLGPALASVVIAAASPGAALAVVALLETVGVVFLLAVRPVPLRRELAHETEVLTPFVIKDRAGGGPGDHAMVMAAFGIGGAIGSLGMASLRMPRRYLTAMILFWGAGCLPLIVVGSATDIGLIAAAVFVLAVCFYAPTVIWGTLLQRRVPPAMLGRVSSLDFFVSLVFMPCPWRSPRRSAPPSDCGQRSCSLGHCPS
jgi:hypothetical protein